VPTGRRGDPSHMRRVNFLELRYDEVRLRILAVSYVCWAMNLRRSTEDNLPYRAGAMHNAGGELLLMGILRSSPTTMR
jgi:hypothetical protein